MTEYSWIKDLAPVVAVSAIWGFVIYKLIQHHYTITKEIVSDYQITSQKIFSEFSTNNREMNKQFADMSRDKTIAFLNENRAINKMFNDTVATHIAKDIEAHAEMSRAISKLELLIESIQGRKDKI